jgi:segregation and condensation protein B
MSPNIKEIESIVEAVLFASGEAVSLEKLSEICGIDNGTMRKILQNLEYAYKEGSRGICISEIDGKYQLCTKHEYYDYVQEVMEPRANQPMSQAALEVLAVIAYNQPVTRAAIEKIRGVNSDSAISKLLERDLIYVSGTLEGLGRPRLYRTTDEFLRVFGIKDLGELPELNDKIDKSFFEVIEDE